MPLVITKAARALVGIEGAPDTLEVEKGLIKHFAHSMAWPNEPNPLYYDETYAEESRFTGLTAPPLFTTRVRGLRGIAPRVLEEVGECVVTMNGGNSYEILRPIRPGDILTGRGRLASLKESARSDGGALLVVRYEGRIDNQREERIVNWSSTSLRIYSADQLIKE